MKNYRKDITSISNEILSKLYKFVDSKNGEYHLIPPKEFYSEPNYPRFPWCDDTAFVNSLIIDHDELRIGHVNTPDDLGSTEYESFGSCIEKQYVENLIDIYEWISKTEQL